MFGYININQKIMTEENRKAYQAYYCGLCQRLKSNCGAKGQMLLNYDMTFLIVLLTGLYELTNESSEITCALHPTRKRQVWINEATDYAADMNLIVAYHNLIDDWKDEKAYTKKAFAKMLDKDYARVIEKYPRQVHAVEEFMRKTDEVEARGETNLDVVAGLTGEMLGERMSGRKSCAHLAFTWESSSTLWMPMRITMRIAGKRSTIHSSMRCGRVRMTWIRSAVCCSRA